MDGSAAAERIARICDSVGDARSLRLQLIAQIRRVIDFDAYVWLLTDPETSVGSVPLADVPCLPELARLIRLKYLTDVNRWTTLGPRAVGSLYAATGGDLRRSRLWRELLAGYGIGDMASSAFKDRYGFWGFLDLWRYDTAPQFSEADLTFLSTIIEPVTTAMRRCQANTFVHPISAHPRRPGPVVLLFSPDLDVLGQTPETHKYLRVLVPPSADRRPIPASAYNVAAQLLALEADVDQNPPLARVHLADGLWLALSAARMGDSGPLASRNIAVTIEEASPSERVSIFARAFALSPRESQLLRNLVTGSDTRQLAAQMFLSEHTVQDHLKAIFVKTATHSRRTLLSRCLGT
ncbi:MAG: helix-turn-helix transcriptional regulator [Dermatophilaceae bacterium]